MYYDPLASRRSDDDDACMMPPDDGNENGGNNDHEEPTPPSKPQPPTEGLPADAIDPRLLSLAMGFVPYQSWETPYANDVALARGTIFPSLDKPFLGERPVSEQQTLRWGG